MKKSTTKKAVKKKVNKTSSVKKNSVKQSKSAVSKASPKKNKTIPKKQVHIILILGIIVLLGIYYLQNAPTPSVQETIVARINGENITLTQLNQVYAQLPKQYSQVPKTTVLDQMVQATVFYQTAVSIGEAVSLEEAKKTISDLREKSGLSEESFRAGLEKRGLNEESLARQYVRQLTVQNFIKKHAFDLITVSLVDAKQYYADNPSEFKVGEEVVARHILLGDPSMTSEEQKAKAEELLPLLTEDNFCEYVRNYSTDVGSIQNCGEYTFTKDAAYVSEFKNLSFNQNIGDMGITQSQFGYHIIWTKDKIPPKTISFADAKDKLIELLKRQREQQAYIDLYKEVSKNFSIEVFYSEKK